MKATDFEKLETIMEQLMLGDEKNPDGTPVKVKVFRDTRTQRAYQVDFKNSRYREATHVILPYGDWKPFSK